MAVERRQHNTINQVDEKWRKDFGLLQNSEVKTLIAQLQSHPK